MTHFIDFIYSLSQFQLFFFITAFWVLVIVIPFLFVRYFLSKEFLSENSELVGYGTSTISVVYAIIVGFTMLYLYETANHAQEVVSNEAQAVSDLYYDAKWLPASLGMTLQNEIKEYTETVIDQEWPAMAQGKLLGNQGNLLLDNIRSNLNNAHADLKNNIQIYTLRNIIDDARMLTNARDKRIELNQSVLSDDIWFVVIIASILTIILNYFFSANFYLHLFVVLSITVLVATVLYLLILLDRPFRGPSAIKPDALQKIQLVVSQSHHANTQLTPM